MVRTYATKGGFVARLNASMERCSDSCSSDISEDALRVARRIPLPPPPLRPAQLQDSESATFSKVREPEVSGDTLRSDAVLPTNLRASLPWTNLPTPLFILPLVTSVAESLAHTSPAREVNDPQPMKKRGSSLSSEPTVGMLRTLHPRATETTAVRIPTADDAPGEATAVTAAPAVVGAWTLIKSRAAAKNTATPDPLDNTLNVNEKRDMAHFRTISDSSETSDASFFSRASPSTSSTTAVDINPRRELLNTLSLTSRMGSLMTGVPSQCMPHRSFRTLSPDKVTEHNKDDDVPPDQYNPRTLFEPIVTAIDTAVLSVTVLGMSQLHADPSVVHPFVRVWLLNGTTGEILVIPVAGRVPFAHTYPVDLRLRRTRAPWWGVELALPVLPCAMKAESNAVLLLEVLDTGEGSFQDYRLRRGGLYPVCWGFLKIRDVYGRLNLRERINVEMFPFPQRVSLFTRALQQFLPFSLSSEAVWAEAETPMPTPSSQLSPHRESNFFVPAFAIPSFSPSAGDAAAAAAAAGTKTSLCPPELFYIYRDARNRKVPYGAGMVITLKSIGDSLYSPRASTILPYEEYLLKQVTLENGVSACRVSFTTTVSLPIKRQRMNKSLTLVNMNALGESYLRKPNERVVPPAQILQVVQIKGRVTCVAISHESALLAMGITAGCQHFIQLHSILERGMPPFSICCGHEGHIHHTAFRSDAQFLLSCSSDKTVRVWRLGRPDVEPNTIVGMQLCCLCVLPHVFPVYCGIFYHDHIITCGFDSRLLVWYYEKELSDQLIEFDSLIPDAYRRKIREVISLDSTVPVEVQIPVGSPDPFLGKVVHVTEENDVSTIYAVCATELNRVWSVDAGGNVLVWRALYEHTKDGKQVWQMSVRRRFKCPGATHVEVCGSRAFVTCAKSAVVYLFDATTYQLVREMPLPQRPYLPAVTLLPDGEVFVAATSEGSLLCWECSTGNLCTSRGGYAKVRVHFTVARIVWANGQQLGVFVGCESPAGHTPLAIVGTPRTEASVVRRSNPHAQEIIRAQFAGEITETGQRGRRGYTNLREGLKVNSPTKEKSSRSALGTREAPFTDKTTRMGQIISLWKGFVGQHRRVKESAEDGHADVRDPAAPYTVVK